MKNCLIPLLKDWLATQSDILRLLVFPRWLQFAWIRTKMSFCYGLIIDQRNAPCLTSHCASKYFKHPDAFVRNEIKRFYNVKDECFFVSYYSKIPTELPINRNRTFYQSFINYELWIMNCCAHIWCSFAIDCLRVSDSESKDFIMLVAFWACHERVTGHRLQKPFVNNHRWGCLEVHA